MTTLRKEDIDPRQETPRVRRGFSWWKMSLLVVLLAAVGIPVGLIAAGRMTPDDGKQLLQDGVGRGRNLAAAGMDRARGLFKSNTKGPDLLTYEVTPIDLRVTVLEMGTLESASSVKVFSEVEGQIAVIGLVPEGTRVSKGDLVVELDTSALKTRRTEQMIIVQQRKAAKSQAAQAYTIAESQAESDINSAKLLLEFAELDQRKYLVGDYPQQVRTIESKIALANGELNRAKSLLEQSQMLYDEGFYSDTELESDKAAVDEANIKLEMARGELDLLRDYTHTRMKREHDSKVEEATAALERIRNLTAVSLDQARTKQTSEQSTLQLEEGRLTKLEDQIEKCSMLAPQDGVVVYPIPEDDDRVDLFIKQGAVVRERQHVFSIPDTDIMRVSTSINEAMVNSVKDGMKTRIWIEVYPDMELRGDVTFVSPLPDPEDWRRTTVKFYETHIALDTQEEGLRPGMSAKVEVLIDAVRDVLALPVQSVVQRGRRAVCYVLEGDGPYLRVLSVGRSNEQFIEITDGLQAGELVVLAPDVLGVPESVLQQLDEPAEDLPMDSGVTIDSTDVDPDEPIEEIEYEAVLVGEEEGTVADVEYEIATYVDNRIEKEFDLEIAGGQPGDTWEVIVNGVNVGSVTLDENGGGEFSWETEKGTWPSNFPPVTTGAKVTVGELSGELLP